VEILSDPARRESMGRAAAKSVSRRFCVDVVVPQYEQYYRDILALPMRSSR